jgi:hypothetical protein
MKANAETYLSDIEVCAMQGPQKGSVPVLHSICSKAIKRDLQGRFNPAILCQINLGHGKYHLIHALD